MCFYGALVHKTQDITSTKSQRICVLFRKTAKATVNGILARCSMFGKDFVLVFDPGSQAHHSHSLSPLIDGTMVMSVYTWLLEMFPDYTLILHVGVCSPLGVCT